MAIIGAGLSGLTAASFLKEYADITIYEKARGVGGRMSTRRAGPYCFDHGSQYFMASTNSFQNFIQPLIDEGVISPWYARYAVLDRNKIIHREKWCDRAPHYVGIPGMNAIGKYLAKGLNVQLNTHIRFAKYKDRWELLDTSGQTHKDFDWVISTVPSPQALELTPKSFKYYSDIKAIKMQACFSLMMGFKKKLSLEFDTAHVKNSDVSWIALNSRNPKHPGNQTLVLHSSAAYAEANIENDLQEVTEHLVKETNKSIGHEIRASDYQRIHKWRYATTSKTRESSIFIDKDLKFAVCGDWCLDGQIEGAFTTASNLVNEIKENAL